MTPSQALSFVGRLELVAADVGRLRRRVAGDDYAGHLVDRVALSVDALDAVLQPTAGELMRSGTPTDAALQHVDARARHIRSLLGEKAA